MLKRTSPNELTALTLLDAQALIERGWCQCALANGGGVCALGAINQATTGDPYKNDFVNNSGAHRALKRVIGGDSIVKWNNAPERTQAEVIEAFGKAAELARESVPE